MITADHKVLDEEQESIASQICSGRARLADAMDSMSSMQYQISSRDEEKSEKILTSRGKPKVHLYGQLSGIHHSLRKAELQS